MIGIWIRLLLMQSNLGARLQTISLGLVMILSLSPILMPPVKAQERPAPAPQQADASSVPYVPELGDLMEMTQLRHFKLWYAGNVSNWDLANYELGQMKKSLDAAAKFYPVFKTVTIGKLIAEVSNPALAEIDRSIKARDSNGFLHAFDKLTDACNSCHQATGFGFIAIHKPTSSPFSNQSFAPLPR